LTGDEARARAGIEPEVARHVGGRDIDRVVRVPDRLLNPVTFRR